MTGGGGRFARIAPIPRRPPVATAAPRRRRRATAWRGACSTPRSSRREPDMEVAAIVTGDPDRAAAAAADHPGARVLASADALWDDSGAVDLVVVAAANRAHVPLARAAIAAGLPVVVDKPLAPDAAQARALADEARGGRGDAHRVPEPPLGRRSAHRAAPAGGGGGRRAGALRVALRPVAARGERDAWRERAGPRGRRRAARGPRQPPHRPGDPAVRPARGGPRRGGPPPARRAGGRRRRGRRCSTRAGCAATSARRCSPRCPGRGCG